MNVQNRYPRPGVGRTWGIREQVRAGCLYAPYAPLFIHAVWCVACHLFALRYIPRGGYLYGEVYRKIRTRVKHAP